jgi:hypothetical protein
MLSPMACASLRLPASLTGWASTSGGLGGPILKVWSLEGSGPGSLREALSRQEPRIIVFEVSGIIDLARQNIVVNNPYVTIAGQTAPDPGITLIRGGLEIRTHDVIVRHIRVRPGASGFPAGSGWEVDGLTTTAAHDVIIDQCSFSWATDENLSASGGRFVGGGDVDSWRRHTSRRVTFSRNIVSEALSHSSHPKGEHSKGTLIHDNCTDIMIVGNIFAHNRERNVMFKGGVHALASNNVIYNPGRRCMHYALIEEEWLGRRWERGKISLVGNVLRAGPSSARDLAFMTVEGQGGLDIYMFDNRAFRQDGEAIEQIRKSRHLKSSVAAADQAIKVPDGFVAMSASSVEDWTLLNAGARPWSRDSVDRRIILEVARGGGKILDSENEVGGYPQATPRYVPFVENEWDLTTMTRSTDIQRDHPTSRLD